MSRRPFWLIECLDHEEAQALLDYSPIGSHIEVVPKDHGDLVILWVPVSDEYIERAGWRRVTQSR
jgi:hypothetical protein